MGKNKVKVKSVTEIQPNSGVNPVLVKFEHAAVNPNLKGSLDLSGLFGAAVFESEIGGKGSSRDLSHLRKSSYGAPNVSADANKEGTSKRQVVALQSDNMTYIGTKGFDNQSLVSSEDDKMRTYLALKHKKSLRIFEVTPITLSPYLEGFSHVVEKPRETGIEKSRDQKREAVADLVKAFGSKKKRLTYERIEKNKIDISDMQQSIDSAVDKLEVPQEEVVIKDESFLTLVPPCNRGAASAHDVYSLEDLITHEEMNAMDEFVDQMLSAAPYDINEWRQSKKYSDYFFAMWTKLQPKRNDVRAIRIAKIVLYTEILIIFLKLKHESIRKRHIDLPKDFPNWMAEKVCDNFTTMNANGNRNRPDAYKDKACCYVMVLVLLANDLHFDVPLMSTSLNIHINKLLTLAKACGITITSNPTTKEHRGILKLPLPQPVQRRGRKRAIR